MIDNDTVSMTNINRQSIASHSTLGQYKTKVMKERISDICPEIEVETHEVFVLPDNLGVVSRKTGLCDRCHRYGDGEACDRGVGTKAGNPSDQQYGNGKKGMRSGLKLQICQRPVCVLSAK